MFDFRSICEEFESRQFQSYFKDGIRYLKGGFDSGFNKVVDELKPTLMHIKGKKRPLVVEVSIKLLDF